MNQDRIYDFLEEYEVLCRKYKIIIDGEYDGMDPYAYLSDLDSYLTDEFKDEVITNHILDVGTGYFVREVEKNLPVYLGNKADVKVRVFKNNGNVAEMD